MPTVAMVTVAIATEAEGQVARASNQGKFDLIRIYYANRNIRFKYVFYSYIYIINKWRGAASPLPSLYKTTKNN